MTDGGIKQKKHLHTFMMLEMQISIMSIMPLHFYVLHEFLISGK